MLSNDGGGDVGGNYQEGELNENTVVDAALSKVWGLSMRPVENNYWSPGVNISWKLTAIPWILSQSPRQAAQKHWVKLFYSNVYPVSWGDGMHEVVAGDPNQNETTNWIVNFFQVSNLGEFIKYDTMFKRHYPFLHMHSPACSIFWVGRLQTPVYKGR